MSRKYVDNVCAMLRRKGLSEKYECAGIYCIKLNEQIVYIGKSRNMLLRIAEHYVGIKQESEKKYRILAELQRKGHTVCFDVLYYAQKTKKAEIEEEIGEKEGVFIRKHRPPLNTQIPKANDWHKFDTNHVDAKELLQSLL